MAQRSLTPATLRPTTIGMLLFLLSEATFFLVLILMFISARAEAPAGMTGVERLDPWRAGMFTLALLASSGTIWLAERNQHMNRRGALRLWLVATLTLGAIFLAGQATEYAGLIREGMTVATSLFGTHFYTLTGLHFLHVTAGVVLIAVLALLALRGKRSEPGIGALQPISAYWHFVDGVWIVLYVVIYLVRP
ncbi:MAG: cytochrome b6 [Dehalococcoidia bacterium]|nr:MAG: cytochrome b6 [Dehalococcoidia bacterium]